MRWITLLSSLLVLHAPAEEKPKDSPPPKPTPEDAPKEPVTREGSVTIDGRKVDYTVTSALLQLKKADGTPRASVFHVSYLKKGADDPADRPVTFAFNGGPGSSAVWLHLGVLGPYIVDLPGDGTEAPEPPAGVVTNPHSILDRTDLVFVDPVSTGYSRAEEKTKPSEFHGFNEDIESLGDFIRRWITDNRRWASPKFLIGESYGGIRVTGLSEHLQSRYGMSLNGVVLLSSLLDFRTLRATENDPLCYAAYLPTYTAVAHHHGKVEGDRDKLVAEANALAFGDFTLALLAGNTLADDEKGRLASRLAALTGLPAELFMAHELRLDPSTFRAELLRDEGKVVGRFDARVAWPTTDPTSNYPSYDPSYSLAYGAYATAMLGYLGEHLGWQDESPYEVLTGKGHPWNWGADNQVTHVTARVEGAMRDNPSLQVLVMKGLCDLATPPGGIEYSLRQMVDAPDSILDRIGHTTYEAGHMFYLNPPDLEKSRKDLVKFIDAAK